MTNQDILNLVNGGILVASAHSLPVEQYYKWYKFRRQIERQYQHIDAEQAAIMKECGIQPGGFEEASKDALARFDEMNKKMMKEEVDIKIIAPIPYEFYRGVYDENRAVDLGYKKVDVFANIRVEDVILQTLFKGGENDE